MQLLYDGLGAHRGLVVNVQAMATRSHITVSQNTTIRGLLLVILLQLALVVALGQRQELVRLERIQLAKILDDLGVLLVRITQQLIEPRKDSGEYGRAPAFKQVRLHVFLVDELVEDLVDRQNVDSGVLREVISHRCIFIIHLVLPRHLNSR